MQVKNRCPGVGARLSGLLIGILLMSSCSLIQSKLNVEDHPSRRANIDSLTNTCWNERVDNAGLAQILGEDALRSSQEIDYQLGIGRSCKCLASIASANRKYQSADSLLQIALDVLEIIPPLQRDSQQIELLGQVYLQVGNVKLRNSSREAGLEWYLKGAQYASEHNLSSLDFSFSLAIARQEAAMGKIDAADSLFRQVIRRQENFASPAHQLGNAYYSYGIFLARRKQYEASLLWLEKAKAAYRDLPNYQRYYAMVLNGLISVEQRLGNVEKAGRYFQECLNIKTEVSQGQPNDLSYEYHSMGGVYLRRKDWANSEALFTRSMDIAQEAKDHKLLAKSHLGLSLVHSGQEDWDQAYQHLKKSYTERDSFISIQRAAALSSLLSGHEKKVAERDAAKSKAEAATFRNRNMLLLSLVGLLGLGIVLFRQRVQHRHRELLKVNELLIKDNEIRANNAHAAGQEVERKRIADALHDSMGSKLAALRMNLEHFKANNENSLHQKQHLLIKNLLLLDEAITYNQDLAYQLIPPTLSKFGLPAALHSLKDRMETEELHIHVSVYGMQDRLPEKLELSLYRTVEELMKNIIRHSEASEVSIQLTEHDGESFNLIVEDNGRGFDYHPQNPNMGMGLSNIKSRVEHFNGTLEIDSTIGIGTTVILDVPFPKLEMATS